MRTRNIALRKLESNVCTPGKCIYKVNQKYSFKAVPRLEEPVCPVELSYLDSNPHSSIVSFCDLGQPRLCIWISYHSKCAVITHLINRIQKTFIWSQRGNTATLFQNYIWNILYNAKDLFCSFIIPIIHCHWDSSVNYRENVNDVLNQFELPAVLPNTDLDTVILPTLSSYTLWQCSNWI